MSTPTAIVLLGMWLCVAAMWLSRSTTGLACILGSFVSLVVTGLAFALS